MTKGIIWGNKNWLPSMKVKKLETFQNKMGLKACKWSSLNAPGTETPQSYPYWELGEFPFPNMDKTGGFQCLGHSNWTTCSPLSPFGSEIFCAFSRSYWGANSYYPRGLIMGVGRISPFPIWMRLRGFSAWGIQTGPLAAL